MFCFVFCCSLSAQAPAAPSSKNVVAENKDTQLNFLLGEKEIRFTIMTVTMGGKDSS